MFVNVCMVMKDRPTHTLAAVYSMCSTTKTTIKAVILDDCSEHTRISNVKARLPYLRQPSTECYFIIRENECPLGVGGSKNAAVLASQEEYQRGDYLYITDNDVLFTPGWLGTLIEAIEEHPQVKIVGGYAHPYNGTNQTLRGKVSVDIKNAVDGLSWLMKWETWDKYGTLMDNARGVRQSEDWEYCQRVRNDGFEVGVVYPHVVINNGIVDTFGEKIPDWERVLANHGR